MNYGVGVAATVRSAERPAIAPFAPTIGKNAREGGGVSVR